MCLTLFVRKYNKDDPLLKRYCGFFSIAHYHASIDSFSFFFCRLLLYFSIVLLLASFLVDGSRGMDVAVPSTIARDRAIGWVNVQLIDHESHLRSGLYSLKMWPDDRANPIGTFLRCVFCLSIFCWMCAFSIHYFSCMHFNS